MVREFKVGSISASRCGIEVTGKVQSIEVMHSKERREKVKVLLVHDLSTLTSSATF